MNAAIQVFGRRFFKDQTPVEYLTEFLLVFASPKDETNSNSYSFPLYSDPPKTLSYQPRYRLALKLFSFLGASKLETRHRAHILAFREGIGELERRISPSSKLSHNDSVRLIQGVFSGFVGVAGDRTWTAHTFLPASESLLARETLWKHEGPNGAAKFPDLTWHQALTNEQGTFFNTSAHSFLARGGEHLYLQLTSLFNNFRGHSLVSLFPERYSDSYAHLISGGSLDQLRERLQSRLKEMLIESDQAIGQLGAFVNQAFEAVEVGGEGVSTSAELGWVPTATATEAALFAWEAENICRAQRSGLQKISLLRDLCVLHVMRSLCFQSARVVNARKTHNFIGNFAWVASPPGDLSGDNVKKIAINSYLELENLLYDSLRKYEHYEDGAEPVDPLKRQDWLSKGDDNVRNLFRRVGKKIGVIVPRNGSGMRIALPAHIVRLLVAALVPPGTRIRLDTFYERIFAHFGLAINQDMIHLALDSSPTQSSANAFGIDSSWFEEELRRGGYLIPLSDAVALVLNPYKG
ncbi:hypothetical protein [Paraburkholderia atlantica]|uniref:hypothetical protein n=1 Tax=Paraburkholderia atlantica TaxID=2654982 RepID=UPI0016184FA7|nr:hypothetical protein [Paraburkholderia atlantica]MBB5509519.1 hypothetical protein [Paraburkholderia atlantica]